MKIAVTGALGHIGSYIIKKMGLNNPDYNFVLIDNFLTQRYSSLFNLPENIKYNFVELDVSCSSLEDMFKDVDIVIHLAAVTDAAKSFENAEMVERNNLLSTKNIAKTCLMTNTKLIFLSTTSVYGTQKKVVVSLV